MAPLNLSSRPQNSAFEPVNQREPASANSIKRLKTDDDSADSMKDGLKEFIRRHADTTGSQAAKDVLKIFDSHVSQLLDGVNSPKNLVTPQKTLRAKPGSPSLDASSNNEIGSSMKDTSVSESQSSPPQKNITKNLFSVHKNSKFDGS